MKKISTFALIATLFSTCTFAAPESKDAAKDTANEPTIYLSVFDRTNEPEPSPDLHKKEMSRSKKTEKVCWVATGNFGKKATVSETFKAQAQVGFTSSIENAKVVSSPNKKLHTITYTRPTLENGKYMMNCWTFDRRDPIGKYVLTVKIGKHEFEKQVFYVTE
mgnify:CR=1 FL=1